MCAVMVKRRASKSPTGSTPSKARKKERNTEEGDETATSESLEAPRTASKRALSMTTAAIRKRREREKKRKEAEEAMEVSSDDESMADVKSVDSDASKGPSTSTGFYSTSKITLSQAGRRLSMTPAAIRQREYRERKKVAATLKTESVDDEGSDSDAAGPVSLEAPGGWSKKNIMIK